MSRRRVVITGMGVISPHGDTVDALYQGQIKGQSAISRITRFDASSLPTQIAGEIRNFDLSRYVTGGEKYKAAGLNTQFALAATKTALQEAGVADSKVDGAGIGGPRGAGEGRQGFERLMPLIAKTAIKESRAVVIPRFCEQGKAWF